jgi:putative FmdB family regulatory protein
MPIYEYRCDECGAQKEILQRLNDAPLTVCPECGKTAMKKMVTAAGFQLKGTGWYVTDFRDKSPKKAPSKSETSGEKSAGKGDKAGEKSADKPAEKSGDAAKPAETTSKEAPKKESSKTDSAAPAPSKTSAE